MRDSAWQTETGVHPGVGQPNRSGRWLIWSTLVLLSAGTVLYAMTRAFVWDEGFHLLAAQMVLHGKRPYLDFCFPQTPLNVYWNAAWMWVFGQSWRVSHIPSSLELIATLLLLWRYLRARLPAGPWKTASVFIGLLLFSGNSELMQFGPIGQAYAICVFAGMASFLLTARAAASRNVGTPLLAGLCIGAGAASSLLIAPAALVLLVWLYWYNAVGNRVAKAAMFLFGCAIPFAPVFWLFAEDSHVVFFNIVQYQTIFRRADWAGWLATIHDVDVLSAWVDDGQTLLLLLLCAASVLYVKNSRNLDTVFRREFWLAAWTCVVLALYISTAHPTFTRYYIVGMPLFAIVATPGLMAAGSRLLGRDRPLWPSAVLAFILLLALGRALFDDRDAATWSRYEEISADVANVTPVSARLLADEHVYFLLHRVPPSGLEFSYSHKVDVSPKQAALLHIIPEKELDQQIKSGVYATVETCDDDKVDSWNLEDNYKQRKDVEDCSVFWDFQGKHGK